MILGIIFGISFICSKERHREVRVFSLERYPINRCNPGNKVQSNFSKLSSCTTQVRF